MQTIPITLDKELLAATDHAAERQHIDRSGVVRDALRIYLERRRIRDLEEQDLAGYELYPDGPGDLDAWEHVAAWPDS